MDHLVKDKVKAASEGAAEFQENHPESEGETAFLL